jgi:hypothetical protein
VRDTPRPQPPHRAPQYAEAAAALLARLEQELHPDADPERRPASLHPLTERVCDVGEAAGGTLDVAHARDHRERRLAHDVRSGGDNRLGAGAREGGGHTVQVAGAVVDEHNAHASPFVERNPSLSVAQA